MVSGNKISDEIDKAGEATHDFISNYVLQMKQPINSLAMLVEKMQHDADEKQTQANLSTVEDTLRGMENLLNTLVNALRLSKPEICLLRFDLEDLLLEVATEMRKDVHNGHVAISVDITEPVTLLTDRQALKALLAELVSFVVCPSVDQTQCLKMRAKTDDMGCFIDVSDDSSDAGNTIEEGTRENVGEQILELIHSVERMGGSLSVKTTPARHIAFCVTIHNQL
jgi:light-regulated signal transduction histidine kinase (bacteriophytochrome)